MDQREWWTVGTGKNVQASWTTGMGGFDERYTIAAERTAEMSRHPDGGPSRHRGGAQDFFRKRAELSSITASLSTSWPEAYSSDTRSKSKARTVASILELRLLATTHQRD